MYSRLILIFLSPVLTNFVLVVKFRTCWYRTNWIKFTFLSVAEWILWWKLDTRIDIQLTRMRCDGANQRVTKRCPFARCTERCTSTDAKAAVEVGGRTKLVGRRWSGQYSGIGAALDRAPAPNQLNVQLPTNMQLWRWPHRLSVRSARRPEAAAAALASVASCSVMGTCCVVFRVTPYTQTSCFVFCVS